VQADRNSRDLIQHSAALTEGPADAEGGLPNGVTRLVTLFVTALKLSTRRRAEPRRFGGFDGISAL
jgi:hypothetical protein